MLLLLLFNAYCVSDSKVVLLSQNPIRKRQSMASSGLNAEEALRLHEDHHQPKRPARVQLQILVSSIKAIILI